MPSQNEVSLLRDQITEEVNRDAEVIGNQLFGQALREPDIAHVSQQMLEQRYRQAFLSGDRDYLGQEAQRDPRQFMKVAQAIGVVHPDNLPSSLQPVAQPQPQPAPPPNPLAQTPPAVPSLAPPLPAAAPLPQPAPSLPAGGPVDPALLQAAAAPQVPVNPAQAPVNPAILSAAIQAAAAQQAAPPQPVGAPAPLDPALLLALQRQQALPPAGP